MKKKMIIITIMVGGEEYEVDGIKYQSDTPIENEQYTFPSCTDDESIAKWELKKTIEIYRNHPELRNNDIVFKIE